MKCALLLLLCVSGRAAVSLNVVFVGTSFTWGYVSGSQSPNNYPKQTLTFLKPSQYDATLHNLGVSGIRMGPKSDTGSMLAHAAADVDTLIVAGKTNIIVVEGGSVDINVSGQNDITIYGWITQYYTERKNAGWNIIIGTTVVSGQHAANARCDAEAFRNGATWANVSATYFSPPCNCPGNDANGNFCGEGSGVTGVNAHLRANHGDATYFLDPDALSPFFSPFDFSERQSDGHWLDNLNGTMATVVAGFINALSPRCFPMPSCSGAVTLR